MPTACELAGVEIPAHGDGISLLPTLQGQKQRNHEYLFWRYGSKVAVRSGNWKAVRLKPNASLELYDLSTDIGEAHDVSQEHPDIVQRMTAYLAAAEK